MKILDSHLPTINSNIGWSIVGQLASIVLGFASSIILARLLELNSRGYYSLIVTTALVFSTFLMHNGVAAAATYLVSKKTYPIEQVAGFILETTFVSFLLLLVVLACLPLRTIDWLLPDLKSGGLWLSAVLTLPLLLNGLFTSVLVGADKIRLAILFSLFSLVLDLVLQVVFLGLLKWGFRGAIWQLGLSGAIDTIIILLIFTFEIRLQFTPTVRIFKETVFYAVPQQLGYIGAVFLGRADLYFVAFFAGPAAVGIYAIAKGLAEIIGVLEQPISMAITPKVNAVNEIEASAVIGRSFTLALVSGGLIALISALLAPWFIPFLYGDKFEKSVIVYLIMLPGAVFSSARVLNVFFSIRLGRPDIPMWFTLVSGLVSLPIFYILTHEFKYMGTALAMSLIYVLRAGVAVVLFMFFSKRPFAKLFFVTIEEWNNLSKKYWFFFVNK